MNANEINSLVISAQNGDNASILKLFQNYQPFINNFLKTIYSKIYETNDLKQECYITLVSCIKSYNFTYPFTSYYIKSVKNNIYNLIKHSKEANLIHCNYDFIVSETTLEDLLIQKIDIKKLYSCLNSLKDSDRKIIIDYYFNNLSLTEIARKNNLKYITLVKKRNRIIKYLKNNML